MQGETSLIHLTGMLPRKHTVVSKALCVTGLTSLEDIHDARQTVHVPYDTTIHKIILIIDQITLTGPVISFATHVYSTGSESDSCVMAKLAAVGPFADKEEGDTTVEGMTSVMVGC